MLSLLEWCDIGENILFCVICGKRIEIHAVLILRKRVTVWSGSQVERTRCLEWDQNMKNAAAFSSEHFF
jgi:hypothetical protein